MKSKNIAFFVFGYAVAAAVFIGCTLLLKNLIVETRLNWFLGIGLVLLAVRAFFPNRLYVSPEKMCNPVYAVMTSSGSTLVTGFFVLSFILLLAWGGCEKFTDRYFIVAQIVLVGGFSIAIASCLANVIHACVPTQQDTQTEKSPQTLIRLLDGVLLDIDSAGPAAPFIREIESLKSEVKNSIPSVVHHQNVPEYHQLTELIADLSETARAGNLAGNQFDPLIKQAAKGRKLIPLIAKATVIRP